jgi:RNA polymerase sigma-70 factor (ECF subfamily)
MKQDDECKETITTPVYSAMSSRQDQFEALVRGHSADLYRYAYWLCGQDALAQDLVQDTFLRAWRALDKLREVAAVKAWLVTILRREHARLFERKSMPADDIDDFDLPDPQATPERRTEESALRQAIARLEPKYREPLVLQVLGGFSCSEIAAQLGLGEAAVMTQLFRARQKLKGQLGFDDQAAEVSEL